MKRIDLMKLANEAYDDGFILELYYDEKCGKFVDNKHGGDGLARFIAMELSTTFDPKARTRDQIAETLRVMMRARSNLDDVICALEAHQ